MSSKSYLWPGVPLALGSAILFGASAPLSKLLMGSVDPLLLAGILYLGAGVGLAIIHFGRTAIGLPTPEAPLRRSDLPWLAAVVVFGGMLGPLFLMFGLSQTSASSGSLLLNLEGLATMAIAWVVFRENVDRRLVLGVHCNAKNSFVYVTGFWDNRKTPLEWDVYGFGERYAVLIVPHAPR